MKSKTQEQRKSKISVDSKIRFSNNQKFDVHERSSAQSFALVPRKFAKFSRKSQTEIIGLAIVVVLLIIGMTFVIRFMLAKEPVDYKKQFTQAEIASNTINTFLKTSSRDCKGLTMTELLQNCGYGGIITCPNEQTSCVYALEAAQEIFRETLDAWNLNYEFKAFLQETSPIFTLGSPCPASKPSKTFPIPTGSGAALFVKLDVCG